MSSPGKFISDFYKGKVIEIFVSNFSGQVIEYSQISIENKYILHGRVICCHEEYDVLELENYDGKRFFIHACNIDAFWESGTLNITESISCMIPVADNKKNIK